jgi:hypothetical protein
MSTSAPCKFKQRPTKRKRSKCCDNAHAARLRQVLFPFYKPDELYFEGETMEGWLRATFCAANSCGKRVGLGRPLCLAHTRSKLHLTVGASPIAGVGVFATKKFKTFDWVTPYFGESLTPEELEQRYPGETTAPYTIQIDDVIEDAALERGLGALINHANRPTNANVDYVLRKDWETVHPAGMRRRIWLRCIKPIAAGDEVLANYGPDFNLHAKHTTLFVPKLFSTQADED